MALSGRWLKASSVQPITVARLPGRLISESAMKRARASDNRPGALLLAGSRNDISRVRRGSMASVVQPLCLAWRSEGRLGRLTRLRAV